MEEHILRRIESRGYTNYKKDIQFLIDQFKK
jgi:hypothetical protein